MLFRWQRIATADSRTPRCESMNVSAALYRAGSSVSRGSPTARIIASPSVLPFGAGFGLDGQELSRDRSLADRQRRSVPQRRGGRPPEPHERVLAIGLRVLKVDTRLQSELDDARADARAFRFADPVEKRVRSGHFAERGRRS